MKEPIFALQGSAIDLVRNQPLNYGRETMVLLETESSGEVQFYPVKARTPAIFHEDGSLLIEPASTNLVSYNMRIENPVWVKGSNIFIQADEVKSPDGTYQAERIVVSPGTGNTQRIQRTFQLESNTDYTLSHCLRLVSNRFTPSDVLRITGGVVGNPQVSLSVLNQTPGRYTFYGNSGGAGDQTYITFKTSGSSPNYPDNPLDVEDYAVISVTANTVTISIASNTVQANDFVGGQVQFTTLPSTKFLITGNTQWSAGSVTITLDTTNLPGLGISTSARAILLGAPLQTVTIELYIESSVVFDWGGLFLEEGTFRTSPIYQEGSIEPRSATNLFSRTSPISGLKTFGLFVNLLLWRGDGNIFETVDFKAWIQGGRLYAAAGNTTINDVDPLPAKNVRFFVQVSEELSTISLFVNGILKARSPLNNFTAALTSRATLSSAGVRRLTMLIYDHLLLDGNPIVGDAAQQEVAYLFNNVETLIGPDLISRSAPIIMLTPIVVPPKARPTATTRINAINASTRVVTVASIEGFTNGSSVAVFRDDSPIMRVNIVAPPSAGTITLDSVAGIQPGDYLTQGNVTTPGKATVRLPWDPIDPQPIQAINSGNRRITVTAALSFTTGRAFVWTPEYQEIAEVNIEEINTTTNELTVNQIGLIEVGHIIGQPANELEIDPINYFAMILNPVDGVTIDEKYSNSIRFANNTFNRQLIRPAIQVF